MSNPVIGFGIQYGEELIYCEAVMDKNRYELLFNGNWRASVGLTANETWLQESGAPLPQNIIDEIGIKIESHYD